MSFVHLNCHSDRSYGRGFIKPHELVYLYHERGAKAACITDYGHMNAAVQLYNACRYCGMLPVFGMEVNVVPDKGAKKQDKQGLVLLAKNRTGFYNLVKLATIGAMYFYYVPRIDVAALRDHAEGLVALTGDMQGVAAYNYFAKGDEGIAEVYDTYGDLFGDDLYFELEPVPTESQRVLNEALVECADMTPGMKLVATGDPHYLTEAHRTLHEMVLRGKNFRAQGWAYSFKGPYHVRTRDEMMAGFSDLHGYDVSDSEVFNDALDQVDRIIAKVDDFDLREGTKVPSYSE